MLQSWITIEIWLSDDDEQESRVDEAMMMSSNQEIWSISSSERESSNNQEFLSSHSISHKYVHSKLYKNQKVERLSNFVTFFQQLSVSESIEDITSITRFQFEFFSHLINNCRRCRRSFWALRYPFLSSVASWNSHYGGLKLSNSQSVFGIGS